MAGQGEDGRRRLRRLLPLVGQVGRDAKFGGMRWAVDPDCEVMGLTGMDEPFVSVEVVREEALEAKRTYPRDSFGPT